MKLLLRILGVICALLGVSMAAHSIVSGQEGYFQLGFGAFLLALGIKVFRDAGKSKEYSPSMPVKKGKPTPWNSKNCPECEARMPLEAEKCPECGVRQKPGAYTCSGGVNSGAEWRSCFAGERRQAKEVDSPGYIWRTCQDGSVCERCANNNGHRFSWDEEPPGGHAGAKAKCRCYPEVIIPKY